MSKTLLAVDDSATMRRVFEITFGGEDFRVVTADGRNAALAKLSEEPAVIVVDTSLEGDDAYGLAKEMRQRAPNATMLLLSSRYNPYDAARGREAGADDYMDKPFDTQQMIEKVKKTMQARESGAKPAPSTTATSLQSPFGRPAPQPQAPTAAPPLAAPTAPPPKAPERPAARAQTMAFESPSQVTQAAKPQAPTAVPARPPMASEVRGEPPAPISQKAAAAVGHMAGQLGSMGLTPEQTQAVLALSRETVERVVWEVVPQLAETLIKEEIARLMA